MRRILFITVAVVTFSSGCAFAWLYFDETKTNVEVSAVKMSVEARAESKGLLNGITPTARGHGNGYGQAYKLPDGKKLGEGNECFDSFKQATKRMKVWLKGADHIIERVAPVEQKGKRKSERVVASFPKDEFGNRWVTIMWVQERCIHWMHAPTLEYALELERSRYNPYKFNE